MPNINIPFSDIESLRDFGLLPDNVKNGIIDRINKFQLGDSFNDLPQSLSEIFNIEAVEITSILSVFITLLKTKNETDTPTDEFLPLLMEEIKRKNDFIVNDSDDESDPYSEDEISLIEDVLKLLLGINNTNIFITSIAYDLATDNSSLYLSSKVIEEVRPIVLEKELKGLALFHTLTIHYRKEGYKHSDLYFALDTSDLQELIDKLTESKARIEVIKSQLGSKIIHI